MLYAYIAIGKVVFKIDFFQLLIHQPTCLICWLYDSLFVFVTICGEILTHFKFCIALLKVKGSK